MKKFLLALGVVAALSLLFVGCDKPTDEPETPATPAETTFDGNIDMNSCSCKGPGWSSCPKRNARECC